MVLRDGGNSNSSTSNAPAVAHAPQTAPTHTAHTRPAATSQPAVAGPSGHNNHPHAAPQARAFVQQHAHQHTHQAPYAHALAAARRNAEARRAAVLEALRANPQPAFGASQQSNVSHNLLPAAHLEQFFAAADQQHQGGNGQYSTSVYTASPVLRHHHAPHRNEPDVYILESPSGPRALLINASGATYYSPAAPASSQGPGLGHYEQDQHLQAAQWTANELIREHNERYQHQNQNHLDLARQHVQHMEMLRELQQQHLRDPRVFPAAHTQATHRTVGTQPARQTPGHPPADGIPNFHANIPRVPGGPVNNAGFLAAVWPQVWLMARLILFIWWFTHPTASWTRWATVILLATAVFVVNTGMLDSVANRLWVPIRAHLDGLLPVGNPADEPDQANPAAPANQNVAEPAAVAGRTGGAAPNPADVARRLVERRQIANGQRLMNFARSLERFGILFLASLAPGIAERHVQLVEEQGRRRLQRIREQEEAAAAAAAEAAAAAAAATEADASATPAEKEVSGDAEVTATGSEKRAVAADGVSAN